MKVVVKESLANGRLAHDNRNDDDVFCPRLAKIRVLAENRGTTIEKLALAAALARPWADIVLTGAATVEQIHSSVGAVEIHYDAELDEQIRPLSIASEDYWRARSSFRWN
jgi:aryl-alcohol dehydrogenase-like predicted oxidoreductase